MNADLDEFRTLVRTAFEQARRSGKPNWHEMTSAVLKNRLLQITDGNFSQERYGSQSFIHLVRKVPDLIAFASDTPPFLLRLTDEPAEAATTEPKETTRQGSIHSSRIRNDLWQAVTDYASSQHYVLDPDTGLARPKLDDNAILPELPTVSHDTIISWRRDFIDQLDPSIREKFGYSFDTWPEASGRITGLPGSIRGSWAEFFKEHVSKTLLSWFEENDINPPADMLVVREAPTTTSGPIGELIETRHLRDLIIRDVP
jgi:hypothetical protein